MKMMRMMRMMHTKIGLPLVIGLLSFVFCPLSVLAQTKVSQIDQVMTSPQSSSKQRADSIVAEHLNGWYVERGLDSLDQKKIPKIVTMGLLVNGNLSNFLITKNSAAKLSTQSSYMRVGLEVGGFMDFFVTRHFAIQARLVFTAEQNRFAIGDSVNHLWSFGADIPVLFLYRLGNLEKGYLNVGGGPFAHFTFASNKGVYNNTEVAPDAAASEKPFYVALHDNHAGLMAYVGYEFPVGVSIGANYMISLSDIFGYYKNTKGTELYNVAFYPQRVSLGIAYRWK